MKDTPTPDISDALVPAFSALSVTREKRTPFHERLLRDATKAPDTKLLRVYQRHAAPESLCTFVLPPVLKRHRPAAPSPLQQMFAAQIEGLNRDFIAHAYTPFQARRRHSAELHPREKGLQKPYPRYGK